MIPEPQSTYVLELLAALDDFVVAGAQAMKFAVAEARATKDVDFVLNVLALRDQPLSLADTLAKLGHAPVPESRNFQFVKPIPNSKESMRFEFMAPEEFKRHNDIRVDIQRGVHARACTGGSIAVEQSDPRTISGNLPDDTAFTGQIRVTRPQALVMLKLLALAGRYNNIRGPKEARHDREEAQTHASDIVSILRAVTDIPSFNTAFVSQFRVSQPSASRSLAFSPTTSANGRHRASSSMPNTSPPVSPPGVPPRRLSLPKPRRPFRLSFVSSQTRISSPLRPRSTPAPTTTKGLR
jgi:hypothetical protein